MWAICTISLPATVATAWTDKITAIGTAVGAVGLVATAIGAYFAYRQLKVAAAGLKVAADGLEVASEQLGESRRDRNVALVADYGARWDEERFFESRSKRTELGTAGVATAIDEWLKDRSAPSEVPLLLRVPNYFEDLAAMVEFGGFDFEFVARVFSGLVLTEWGWWRDNIAKIRAELDEQAYVEFEELYKKCKEREDARG